MKDKILDAIKAFASAETEATLGERTSYIGASDLATANTCLRKVAMAKAGVMQEDDEAEDSILMKQRGHWYEAGVLQALEAAGTTVVPQLEIEFLMGATVHKFHLDLVVLEKGSTEVIEMKTTRLPAPALQESYEFQIRTQISALSRLWNQKAFRVQKNAELQTFPGLVKNLFGKEPSEKLVGNVLVFSTRDSVESYGPYAPADDNFWNEVMRLSRQITLFSQKPEHAAFARGFYALCDYCGHQPDCPKYRAIEAQSVSPTLQKLVRVKESIEALNEVKAELEDALKGYYAKVQPLLPKGSYINCSAGRYKVTSSSKKTYSEAAFKEALQWAKIQDDVAEKIMAKAVKNTQQMRLTVVAA